jgi:hypothetical protein
VYSIIYVKPLEEPENQRFRRELRYAESMISCRKSVWKDLRRARNSYTRIPIIANKTVGFTIFIEQVKDIDAIEKSIYDLNKGSK